MSENCRMCLALNLRRKLIVQCVLVDWMYIYSGSTVLGHFVSLCLTGLVR